MPLFEMDYSKSWSSLLHRPFSPSLLLFVFQPQLSSCLEPLHTSYPQLYYHQKIVTKEKILSRRRSQIGVVLNEFTHYFNCQIYPDFKKGIQSRLKNWNCLHLLIAFLFDWPPVSSDPEVPQRAMPVARLVNFTYKVTPLYSFL